MANDNELGIDIVGICAPLVSLAFDLAGNAKVKVTIVVGGSFELDPQTDEVVADGGTSVQVGAMMYRDRNREQADVEARTATLIIDPNKLKAACADEGTDLPPLNNNDSLAITDSTGTKTWTIFEQNPVPGGLMLSYQVRR